MYAKNKIPSGIGTPSGTLSDAMTRLAALPLLHQPGEQWTYGLSVDVVGYLIEVLSGAVTRPVFADAIVRPAGYE